MYKIKTIKKYIKIIGTVLLAAALCACKNQASLIEGNQDNEKASLASDICAQTSNGFMAETEEGYYYLCVGRLYYADKSDLTNWVIVCNDPNCPHNNDTCSAHITSGFRLQDGRVESVRNPWEFDTKNEDEGRDAVYSMARDGSDLRLEYEIEGTRMKNGGASLEYVLEDQILVANSQMQTDGTYKNIILQVSDQGTRTLYSGQSEELTSVPFLSASMNGMRGDLAVFVKFLAGEDLFQHLYRITESGFVEIENICNYDLNGAYLTGDRLLHFVPDDGYYETDLKTEKSQKRMDAQLTNSRAYHLTEQYIVETNLYAQNTQGTPEMSFYDGANWHTVVLPAELTTEQGISLWPVAVATDRIFFSADVVNGVYNLYYMLLESEEPILTLCGELEYA